MDKVMEKKKRQKSGMIRKGAVVPFIVFVTVVVVFNILLLDGLLKKSMEFLGSKINGAEVNVASVETDFKKLSLQIKNIQVSNPENLDFNRLSIDSIKFSLLWDGILRAKFIVNESLISGIRVDQKRKNKAVLLKSETAGEEATQAAQKSLAVAKEEFQGNIFGDLSAVLSGVDSQSQLKVIESDLQSKKKYNEIKSDIDKKEEEWKSLEKSLPQDEEIDSLKKRISSINFKDLGNIKKAGKVLKEINEVKKQSKSYIDQYKKVSQKFKEDSEYLNKSIKEVDSLVEEDVSSLEKRMNIPSLDTKNIAQILFGKEFASKVEEGLRYFNMAKEYLPPKKEKTKENTVIVKRRIGRNYQFGRAQSYPAFWIKKMKIDSENEQGKMQGEILDLTSDQARLNKVTLIKIEGDFPQKGLKDIKINGVIDHRSTIEDKLSASFKSPVENKKLSQSDSVTFNVRQASSQVNLTALIKENDIEFDMKNVFTDVDYEIEAKSSTMKEVLTSVAQETPRITVDATAKGPWQDLKWKINTNLARSISEGLKRHVQGKINGMKKKLRESIYSKIAEDKESLKKRVTALSSENIEKLKGKSSKVDNLLTDMSKKQSEGGKPKVDKVFDSLKKKFKF